MKKPELPDLPEKPSKETVKRESKRVVWVLLGLGLGGLLVALAGLIPIRASSGHMAITDWLLHTIMRRSVATRSITVPSVPLDDPGLLLQGAGHYRLGCQPCHGAPGQGQPEYARHMTPHPPLFSGDVEEVRSYERDDLFYVVRHGVKFTGMPAWPSAHRDDEVWAVVAFLLAMPGMTGAQYEQLSGMTESAGLDEPLATCAACHGADGDGRDVPGGHVFPRLSGQSPEYLFRSLVAFAEGERESGVMTTAVAGLDASELRALARHYARQSPRRQVSSDDPDGQVEVIRADAIARGAELAARGVPDRRVPSCADCHGPWPAGGGIGINPAYPRIAGLHPRYLARQLHLFQGGERGGSDYAHLMEKAVETLTEDEISDLAAYYGSLAPAGPAAPATPGR